jgi:hypothetical protein
MANAVSLYELSNQYLALIDKLENANLDEVTIADTIESTGIVDDFNDKAVGVVMVAKHFEMFDDAIAAEMDRLKELKERRHKAAARLLDYLKAEMIRTGIQRIEHPRMVIALRDNPPAVDIYDERMLPRVFLTTPPPPAPTPDKKAIAAAIKGGGEVPGARLTRGQRLHIA